MNDQPTRFTETNALIAVTMEDDEMAREILKDSTRGELRRLAVHASRLSNLCDDLADEKE